MEPFRCQMKCTRKVRSRKCPSKRLRHLNRDFYTQLSTLIRYLTPWCWTSLIWRLTRSFRIQTKSSCWTTLRSGMRSWNLWVVWCLDIQNSSRILLSSPQISLAQPIVSSLKSSDSWKERSNHSPSSTSSPRLPISHTSLNAELSVEQTAMPRSCTLRNFWIKSGPEWTLDWFTHSWKRNRLRRSQSTKKALMAKLPGATKYFQNLIKSFSVHRGRYLTITIQMNFYSNKLWANWSKMKTLLRCMIMSGPATWPSHSTSSGSRHSVQLCQSTVHTPKASLTSPEGSWHTSGRS